MNDSQESVIKSMFRNRTWSYHLYKMVFYCSLLLRKKLSREHDYEIL